MMGYVSIENIFELGHSMIDVIIVYPSLTRLHINIK